MSLIPISTLYHQRVNNGPGNNAGAVGTIIRLWDKTQLSLWRPGSAVPQDTHNRYPNPDSRETPVTSWTDRSCDIENVFQDTYAPFGELLMSDREINADFLLLYGFLNIVCSPTRDQGSSGC